jgi:hypothetical protein
MAINRKTTMPIQSLPFPVNASRPGEDSGSAAFLSDGRFAVTGAQSNVSG